MNVATSVLSRVQPVPARRQDPLHLVTPPASIALKRRILLVEGEPAIRDLLRLHLTLAGFEIEEAGEGTAALERARTDPFDLIVLDTMIPGLDGITLCRAIRSQGVNAASAILMLSARDTEADKVLGLESGADDCLSRPFGIREMLARVGAILRRNDRTGVQPARAAARQVRVRDVVLDPDRREALVRGRRVDLTKQEFDVLYLLAARPGIVFSRSALLTKVWSDDTEVTERTVDTVISRLRRKVEHDGQHPDLILTAWGVGYKFVDTE